MKFRHSDGGRKAAGYTGDASDCVVRAIAIATCLDYQTVYDGINETAKRERPRKGMGRSDSRLGVYRATYQRYLESVGWEWVSVMPFGGVPLHLKASALPRGRIILRLCEHICAVIDRVIWDNKHPARAGKRCVYGYFRRAR